MAYDARQIANWFVTRSRCDGKSLSIMSLLKLTYIAHGWHLETRNEPLFSNRIEAWQYGPVIPDVYNAFRGQGVQVSKEVEAEPPNFSQNVETFLEEVYNVYGRLTAFQLSDITHVKDGPWDLATRHRGNYAHISDEAIRQHYISKRKLANKAAPSE